MITYFIGLIILITIIMYPITIPALIGYAVILVNIYKKNTPKGLANAISLSLYLISMVSLMTISTFFNETHYWLEKDGGSGIVGKYSAYASGFPFRFLEISSTEMCSGCDDVKIDLLSLFSTN